KSRFKSKQKHMETESKVDELTEENERLHNKVSVLTKELSVLRSLVSNSTAFKSRGITAALLSRGLATASGILVQAQN
uniref:hypothetical protein n=1 Tax=Salmonella sp. s51090 TaxID=3159651 RepID=UPI00397EDB49